MNINKINGFPVVEPNPEKIPDFLKAKPWAVWIAEPRPNKPGKFNKAPLEPCRGSAASTNNPATFGTFEQAVAALDTGRYSGMGVLLTGEDETIGVDIDDYETTFAQMPQVGKWVAKAREAGAYCEKSPSGKGLRLFVRGKLPGSGRKAGSLEIYDNARFLTVTGKAAKGSGLHLIDGQALADEFLAMLPAKVEAPVIPMLETASADPAKVEELAKRVAAKHGELWAGNWEAHPVASPFSEKPEFVGQAGNLDAINAPFYPSQSEADFAMCGHIAREAIRIGASTDALNDTVMSVFERSGLYRAEKRQQVESYAIPKIVAEVLAAKAEAVQKADQVVPPSRLLTLERGRVAALDSSPPREWVVDGFLPKRTVFTEGGAGGSAKTAIAIAVGVAVASGKSFHGMKTSQSGVVFVLGEEDGREASARINAAMHDMDASEKEATLENILAFGMLGDNACMVTTIDRQATPTGFASEVIEVAKEHADAIGMPVGLIVLDHARMLAAVDLNDGNAASVLMRISGKIAVETGACVLLIAHSPKSSISRTSEASAQDIAGSSALVDMARGAALVRVMDEDEAKKLGIEANRRKSFASLEMFKANYAPPFEQLWFEKVYDAAHDTVRAVAVDLQPPAPGVKERKANVELAMRIVQAITEHPGPLWVNKLLDRYAGKSKRLKASLADVELALGQLRANGKVTTREITAEERAEHGIHHTVKTALQVVA